MKEKLKTKQGISLIVLVITIIVIIILAVAVILTLSNNNPIENAHRAVGDNNEAALKEEATLLYADWYLQKNATNETGIGMDADPYVKSKLKGNYSDELINSLFVSNSGEITIEKKESGPVIPKGFVASQAAGENKVETGLVIYEGTEAVTDANVAEARLTRNQFVWVPIEDGNFERDDFGEDISIFEEPFQGSSIGVEEYQTMVASVKKHGGFYIARYEASKATIDGVDTIQIVANQDIWTDLIWGESLQNPGSNSAVGKARAMYPAKDASLGDAVSTLIYGVQWDTAVNFIKKNYPTILDNCYEYGHHNSEEYIKTGSNSEYALNNIYELAGNEYEWTMESEAGEYCVTRGSAIWSDEESSYIYKRYGACNIDSGGMAIRVALYIK